MVPKCTSANSVDGDGIEDADTMGREIDDASKERKRGVSCVGGATKGSDMEDGGLISDSSSLEFGTERMICRKTEREPGRESVTSQSEVRHRSRQELGVGGGEL